MAGEGMIWLLVLGIVALPLLVWAAAKSHTDSILDMYPTYQPEEESA